MDNASATNTVIFSDALVDKKSLKIGLATKQNDPCDALVFHSIGVLVAGLLRIRVVH